VALEEFQRTAAQNETPDPSWVIPRACRHERVIEAVMSRSPALPVRFGAVFSSRHSLEELLASRCTQIADFLNAISDKEEWAVKGFVDLEKTATWLLAADPVLSERRQRLPETPGVRYFQEKRLHADTQKQGKLWARRVAVEIQEELKTFTAAVQPLKPQGQSASGRTAEMVLHCAFLILRHGMADFSGRLEEINSQYAEQGLFLESLGPWPPFNFCPVLKDAPP
jgi:hypothetical protein